MNVRQRAEPLSREERRQAILEAVIPLLVKKGAMATTSEIAQAAGIAEGTIFRVFPDKITLLQEAVRTSFDPEPDLARLAAIDADDDLKEITRQAALILEDRFHRLHTMVSVVRAAAAGRPAKSEKAKRSAEQANRRMLDGLTRLLTQAEDELSVPPDRAAALLNSLMFAIHFPLTAPDDPITTEEAVAVLLTGIRR